MFLRPAGQALPSPARGYLGNPRFVPFLSITAFGASILFKGLVAVLCWFLVLQGGGFYYKDLLGKLVELISSLSLPAFALPFAPALRKALGIIWASSCRLSGSAASCSAHPSSKSNRIQRTWVPFLGSLGLSAFLIALFGVHHPSSLGIQLPSYQPEAGSQQGIHILDSLLGQASGFSCPVGSCWGAVFQMGGPHPSLHVPTPVPNPLSGALGAPSPKATSQVVPRCSQIPPSIPFGRSWAS
ncbi:hypothetical protein DSO57_1024212 [Entomophthora muscae]|uniref:Uncharacterized protein n=1 Tax=Entomophthora muscae TaxID=34485 RepID=A0ACC2U1C5_9FUNG|nr:hypothetical protein DSO57_1024212 [Entomophthora muscae]